MFKNGSNTKETDKKRHKGENNTVTIQSEEVYKLLLLRSENKGEYAVRSFICGGPCSSYFLVEDKQKVIIPTSKHHDENCKNKNAVNSINKTNSEQFHGYRICPVIPENKFLPEWCYIHTY